MFEIIKAKLSKEAKEKKKVEISNADLVKTSVELKDNNIVKNAENPREIFDPENEDYQIKLNTNLQVIKDWFLSDLIVYDLTH